MLGGLLALGTVLYRNYKEDFEIQSTTRPGAATRLRDALTQEKPDLILIGNSMLAENIDETRLEKLLSKKTGRQVNVVLVTQPGAYTAWVYLVLKNQIAAAGLGAVPVGIFYTGRDLSAPLKGLAERKNNLRYIENEVRDDETVFHQRTNNRFPMGRNRTRFASFREAAPGLAPHLWLRLFTLGRGTDAKKMLDTRFQLKFRNIEKLGRPAEEAPTVEIEDSFLPDIIEVGRGMRLFFVEVHAKPALSPTASADYRAQLNTYLKEKNIGRIGLNERMELNQDRLYRSAYYFTEEGKALNTKVLSEELFN